MIPVLFKAHYWNLPDFANMKFMITIHNMKYQGIFGKDQFRELAGLGEEHLHGYALELHGGGELF